MNNHIKTISNFFAKNALQYDGEYCDKESKIENYEIQKHIENFIHIDDFVLDLGCGTGLFLNLNPHHIKYLGIDVCAEMLKVFHIKYPLFPYLQEDFNNMTIGANSVDAVSALFSLFYSTDEIKTISEIHRVLKPNGKVFAIMINRLSLYNMKHLFPKTETNDKALKREGYKYGYVYCNKHSKLELKKLFKGFRIEVVPLVGNRCIHKYLPHFWIVKGYKI